MPIPSYSDLENALERAGAPGTAAEAHGTLCGLLSVGADALTQAWADHVLAETDRHNALAREARDVLDELRQSAPGAFTDDEQVFALLLPDDSEPLDERTAMLGQWCQGFLYGLATGGLTDPEKAAGDVPEVIADLSEITRACFDSDDDTEDGEVAFAELVEYVRVAALLVFETLNPAPASNAPAPSRLQ